MTRFIHDQFAKDYLEEMLTPYGEVKSSRRVSAEVREIDIWFSPRQDANCTELGLLGKLAATDSMFEPFRNPATPDQIRFCLLKLIQVFAELQRESNRNKTGLAEVDLPRLWILTPTASDAILAGFRATPAPDWETGVYFLADYLRAAIVVIHRLKRTRETLWLRLLGKGNVQKQAIDEIENLPPDNPFRSNSLKLLYNLQRNLQLRQDIDPNDQELVMRLAPLYEQEREQLLREGEQRGIQQGIQQAERRIIENLLRSRFGDLDPQMSAIIEPILALPAEEFTPLLLQLSREELISRFYRP